MINRKKIRLVIFIIAILISFDLVMSHGDNFFYTIKNYVYNEKTSEIDVKIDKNKELDNIDLNFINNGSCDVYLRSFVFIYSKDDEESGVVLSNDSIKISYGDKLFWSLGEDNYVYYKEPLKVGSKTIEPMIKNIDISLSEEERLKLENKNLVIDVVVESVQADNFEYDGWDVKNESNVIKLNFK